MKKGVWFLRKRHGVLQELRQVHFSSILGEPPRSLHGDRVDLVTKFCIIGTTSGFLVVCRGKRGGLGRSGLQEPIEMSADGPKRQ